jgi:hypothetical protein
MWICRIALMLLMTVPCLAYQSQPAVASRGVLSEMEMQHLMPPAVFFRGQTATTQLRNSFGMRLSNGGLVLAGLVDTGGYSSAVREQYQFYLLTDTTVDAGGNRLAPGAYGCGFLQDGGFLVMDLGGNELFRVPITRDASLKRPRPLQMQAGKMTDEVRLYLGRDYVTLSHGK